MRHCRRRRRRVVRRKRDKVLYFAPMAWKSSADKVSGLQTLIEKNNNNAKGRTSSILKKTVDNKLRFVNCLEDKAWKIVKSIRKDLVSLTDKITTSLNAAFISRKSGDVSFLKN